MTYPISSKYLKILAIPLAVSTLNVVRALSSPSSNLQNHSHLIFSSLSNDYHSATGLKMMKKRSSTNQNFKCEKKNHIPISRRSQTLCPNDHALIP